MANHLEILRQFNAWRRDQIDLYPHTPTEIGQAIDAVVRECEASRRVMERIGQLCTHQHESKEAFIRRVQSAIEWGAKQ